MMSRSGGGGGGCQNVTITTDRLRECVTKGGRGSRNVNNLRDVIYGWSLKPNLPRFAIFDHIAHLHANDGVDEEEHCQEEADVGQRFERLHEGPQQDADRVALPQQFNEAGRAEKAKKADVYESNIVECFLSIKIVSL